MLAMRNPTNDFDLADLPGGDLISRGLKDLERGETSVESLLVSIAWDDLRRKGLRLERQLELDRVAELELYDLLCEDDAVDDAYSHYNSLIRRLVSFQRALGVAARGSKK